MASNRRHSVKSNATLTASGNSGMLPNLGQANNPTVVVFIDVPNAPTGTSPSMTVTLYGSVDGTRKAVLVADVAITGQLTNPHRIVAHDVLEPNIEVDWVITGTSPSF